MTAVREPGFNRALSLFPRIGILGFFWLESLLDQRVLMRKDRIRWAAAVAGLLGMTAAAAAETLTLLNWEEYLDPAVIERWEVETGIRIDQVYFDNDERRDQILVDVGRHDIDLVVVDEVASRLFGERGLIHAPTREQAPNLQHLEPDFQAQCSQYAVPYMWGTLGIAYRADKVAKPTSWADIMEPPAALYGHIGMMDDITDMLAPTLLLNGHSINTDDRGELEQTFEALRQQVPAVLTYDYAITYLQTSAQADELYMATVYSGDQEVLNAISGSEQWHYVVPDEGTILWVDCLSVVTDSPQARWAERFIDFLNRPEIAALNAEALWVGTPNRAARALLGSEVRADQTVYPPESVMAKRQLYEPISDENLLLRQRMTHAIRKLHESQ
ncbi:MAG: spermidine/putrescine ABC transporter substrate-binding protein [Oceanospirillaceae bacterium]|nr:spermidine/putrescine ABC transporter substrate-binding protein [Oceanospirillaceae bacterium]